MRNQPHDLETIGTTHTYLTKSKAKKMGKKVKFLLNSSNWISQILFLWILKLVYLIHTLPQLKHLHLLLDSKETAQVTGDKLQEKWENEISKKGTTKNINIGKKNLKMEQINKLIILNSEFFI